LKSAAALAISQHHDNDSQPLLPVVIEGEQHVTIVVSKKRELNGLDYIVISRGTAEDRPPDIRIPGDKYQHIHFIGLKDCRVFVMTKLVRAYFCNCEDAAVSIRKPLIGGLEFYKCRNLNLSVRLEGEESIPLTRIENCQTFHIYQAVRELMYVVKLSIDVTGNIIEAASGQRLANYDLGKLFWDSQEQILVCLSAEDGFNAVPVQYALNDIAHHLIAQPLRQDDEKVEDVRSIFGTTPPAHGTYLPHVFRK